MNSEAKLLRDRYRIVAPIGHGGMGAVFLADDTRLRGRQCAIKEVRSPDGAAPGSSTAWRERVEREAAVLARLDHPVLPGVSDCFEAGGSVYLVMDYVPGQDLLAIVVDAQQRGRRIDEAQATRWAEDVCAALTYLHGQDPPIVHRDVKPANIKLTPDGQVRLVDFGLAGPQAEAGSETVTVIAGAGSRPYQPLEQYGDGTGVDARADVYALGAALYHVLAGRPPAPAQQRFLDPGCLLPLRSLRPDVSRGVARSVAAAMEMHPDARPPSAEAFRRLLISPSEPATREWLAAIRANRWLITVLAALLLTALALTALP